MLTIYRTPQLGQADNPPAMQQVATMQKGDWLNLVNPTPEEIRLVSEQTGIAEEFIRYPLDDEELARVETEDGQILIIVDVPVITDSPVIYDTTPLGIVLNDDFAQQEGAGTSMEEALRAMDEPLADIVKNPVPNRDITDYKK